MIILHSVSKEYVTVLEGLPDAKSMWEKLAGDHAEGSVNNRMRASRDFHNFAGRHGATMEAHIKAFEALLSRCTLYGIDISDE
jgi:hypothetical protein